eukprot:CAMPEP_0171355800 /NCGR_PEP_ID=MMETSP0878-20121228/45405_1 /TAXON_ID=67004 /ORGANISM="Thalassiosira weissflogii, Strain CCMP1336" /LENGTH=448 /DNA_ID=CAMNT_0011861807 /DNA_START=198 /DNA_END=1544 /DNA_ORIENTATION=+
MARSVSSRPSFSDTAPSTILDASRDEIIGNTSKNWKRTRLPWNNRKIVNSEGTVFRPTPPLSCYDFNSHSFTTSVENIVSKRKFSNTIRSSNRVRDNDGNSHPSNKNVGKPADTKKEREPNSKPKKVTTLSLASKKRRGQKITMVTAYDYPSAVHVDRAGVDAVLVGDSCAMVELGFETTQPITLDQMIHHCQAVKRGAPNRPLLVGDMPFGSYEFEDCDVALRNAYRMIKEGGMDAVKFEGGSESRAKVVRHVVDGGVAVLGHVGLTPQAISVLGGFRAQGRTAVRARALLDDALRLQEAGAFGIVLECIPANVATAITDALEIPTIGIGAGGGTSGQVLVFHDLLGMLSHPHHEEFVPKFCKQYARVGVDINNGLAQFKKEVEDGAFPGDQYSPYVMTKKEKIMFEDLLKVDAEKRRSKHEEAASKLKQSDEYEQLNLYGDKNGSR